MVLFGVAKMPAHQKVSIGFEVTSLGSGVNGMYPWSEMGFYCIDDTVGDFILNGKNVRGFPVEPF